MTYDAVKKMIVKRTGLDIDQDIGAIEAAIAGALEEIGVHMTISYAIQRESKTIAASTNSISWVKEYSRIVSVTYQYADGSSTFSRPLNKLNPTEFESRNAGLQGLETDTIEVYCPMEGKIYVGQGNVATGGNLIILWQRRLTIQDIEKLPDGMMVVNGAVSNILPADHPRYDTFRNLFVNALAPAATASTPVKEKRNSIELNPQLLRDQIYLEDL